MDYFVFAFMRDPAARRLSVINWCYINWPKPWVPIGSSARGCARRCESVRNCGVCPMNHCTPQWPYVRSATGTSFVDFIGGTATLNVDVGKILAHVSARHQQRTAQPIKWGAFQPEMHVNHAHRHMNASHGDCVSALDCFNASKDGLGHIFRREDDEVESRLFQGL